MMAAAAMPTTVKVPATAPVLLKKLDTKVAVSPKTQHKNHGGRAVGSAHEMDTYEFPPPLPPCRAPLGLAITEVMVTF